MASQGRALRQISRDIWRMNISGIGVQKPSPVLPLHQPKTSSLSHCGSSKIQSPLPFTSFQEVQCAERKETTGVNRQYNKETQSIESLLDISVRFTGLSLYAVQAEDADKSWSFSASGSTNRREHLEYVCPSQKLSILPGLTILEEMPGGALAYDLPKTQPLLSLIIDSPDRPGSQTDIAEPENSQTNAPKEARKIMKIRRKKMKRHLLKKFRKRLAFTLRKMKRDRRKKKELAEQARLAGIKEWGDSFNAREWAQKELDKARLGGFYINVFADKR